ncbi:MAG: hypothetical protein ACRC3B_06085 [Bacteroidia bacterium]
MSSSALQVWNRLEPRPRSNSLTRSLRAEVRDPLWMLTRQWQLGEWNGEDTGTAAFAFLDMQTSRVNRIAKPGNSPLPVSEDVPLECTIEREDVQPSLLICIELGRQFIKMLRAATLSNLATIEANIRASLLFRFSAPPSPNPEFFSNPELWQATLAVSNGRAVNGFELLRQLQLPATTISSLITVPAADVTIANQVGVDFVAWYKRVYSQPASPAEDYWLPRHLEYQFACSAPRTATDYTLLKADEYYQGHLDWYSFDRVSTTHAVDASLQPLIAGTPDTSVLQTKPFAVIPSKIAFGGMPAQRFWEMEDRRVDFGGLTVATTDVAHLVVGEFATLYSNDWTLLPFTVPSGSICNLRGIMVTDVFGQVTHIQAAGAADWQNWNLFTLSEIDNRTSDQRLFVPPVVGDLQESPPVEMVNFMRDEMANMVWGVESVVPNGVSGGERGQEAAIRISRLIESQTVITPVPPSLSNTAEIKFNLMSVVPENWIPFIPVRLGTNLQSRNIQFQRAAMPRVIKNQTQPQRVRPRTSLLREGYNPTSGSWGASYIYEEEIPRSGTILSLTWQRARWHDGRVALWLGRRKQNGRGEGNSGLRFDYLTAK